MARRALDFAQAHPIADASFTTVVQRLNADVTQADALGVQDVTGRTGERAARARRSTLKYNIRNLQLRRLVLIAEMAAKQNPELAGKFLMPASGMANKPFVLAGRALLAAALPHKDLLVQLGLGETYADDLSAALDQYDGSTENAHTGKADHIGAGAEVIALARQAGKDVLVLGTYYRSVYADNAELLAAWKSASNIAGPFKHTDTPAKEAA
jgi:hypothetical protein